MNIFEIRNKRLVSIAEKPIDLEREIQEITQNNLDILFGLKFVKAEFIIQKFRIDTLAFDEENKSFVLIEYKRDKSSSVIDQGISYLSLIPSNKGDFLVELNEKTNSNYKKDEIDWNHPRIIFIAESFNQFQQTAITFRDLPIELWEVKKLANNTIIYNQLKAANETQATIKSLPIKNKITNQIKVYTEEEHLKGKKQEIQVVYQEIKQKILDINPEIEIKPRKLYIGFKAKTNFADIEIRKKDIKLFINLKKGELQDAKKIARDVSTTGHWGNGDYEIKITNNEPQQLNYIKSLIEQSYEKNK